MDDLVIERLGEAHLADVLRIEAENNRV